MGPIDIVYSYQPTGLYTHHSSAQVLCSIYPNVVPNDMAEVFLCFQQCGFITSMGTCPQGYLAPVFGLVPGWGEETTRNPPDPLHLWYDRPAVKPMIIHLPVSAPCLLTGLTWCLYHCRALYSMVVGDPACAGPVVQLDGFYWP